jgi:hypothetical protein
MSMKNSIETIGNRTCDFPACSAATQPTALVDQYWINEMCVCVCVCVGVCVCVCVCVSVFFVVGMFNNKSYLHYN